MNDNNTKMPATVPIHTTRSSIIFSLIATLDMRKKDKLKIDSVSHRLWVIISQIICAIRFLLELLMVLLYFCSHRVCRFVQYLLATNR